MNASFLLRRSLRSIIWFLFEPGLCMHLFSAFWRLCIHKLALWVMSSWQRTDYDLNAWLERRLQFFQSFSGGSSSSLPVHFSNCINILSLQLY
jgi:hypothetical protein